MPDRLTSRMKTWRRLNSIKQETLAAQLGVSQAAISRWENGLDQPSPAHLKQLRNLLAQTVRDEFQLQRQFIMRQRTVRMLCDMDGVRMLGVSHGFSALWPESGALIERRLADDLVGETRPFSFDVALVQAIAGGSLCIASGISDRHIGLQIDRAVRHGWHICFRHYGARVIADMIYEPCDPDEPVGIRDLLHIDELAT